MTGLPVPFLARLRCRLGLHTYRTMTDWRDLRAYVACVWCDHETDGWRIVVNRRLAATLRFQRRILAESERQRQQAVATALLNYDTGRQAYRLEQQRAHSRALWAAARALPNGLRIPRVTWDLYTPGEATLESVDDPATGDKIIHATQQKRT